ncbi:MAG: hypothetical protein EZS28_053156, partial [Streblomastix strix]
MAEKEQQSGSSQEQGSSAYDEDRKALLVLAFMPKPEIEAFLADQGFVPPTFDKDNPHQAIAISRARAKSRDGSGLSTKPADKDGSSDNKQPQDKSSDKEKDTLIPGNEDKDKNDPNDNKDDPKNIDQGKIGSENTDKPEDLNKKQDQIRNEGSSGNKDRDTIRSQDKDNNKPKDSIRKQDTEDGTKPEDKEKDPRRAESGFEYKDS